MQCYGITFSSSHVIYLLTSTPQSLPTEKFLKSGSQLLGKFRVTGHSGIPFYLLLTNTLSQRSSMKQKSVSLVFILQKNFFNYKIVKNVK